MKIILSAVNHGLADSWRRYCGDLTDVVIYEGSIFEVSCDAFVSPANSFGFMAGGIDLLFREFFGFHIQAKLQDCIQKSHCGELVVGQAEIISTGHATIPFFIAAPTMRVPMAIENTVNPYLATRAALLLVKEGSFSSGPLRGTRLSEVIHAMAFPGLGTGIGRVKPDSCAFQMRTAIDDVAAGRNSFPQNLEEATRRDEQLRTQLSITRKDVQYADH